MIARFGTFTFDAERRLVAAANGDLLHLTPKAFSLLALLIERAPHVVTKVEIHERLWPGAFVTDSTLVGLVKELRRVLQEDEGTTPLIRTVHRVGYAFRTVEPLTEPTRAVAGHWISDGQRRIVLRQGENTIGRDHRSHVWLDVAGVSRRHARVVVADQRAEIEDLGSKNGTMLGSEQLTGTGALHDGDAIQLGPVRIVYRFSQAGLSTETIPRPFASQHS